MSLLYDVVTPARACPECSADRMPDGRAAVQMQYTRGVRIAFTFFSCRCCGHKWKLPRLSSSQVLRALELARIILDDHGRERIDRILFEREDEPS